MRQTLVLSLGVILIAVGLLGASLTAAGSGVSAQEGDRNALHEQMHQMMDAMMGEGSSERMHAQVPGAEQMMEACTSAMQGMGNMMNGMDRMRPGMGGTQEGQ
jgi:hypothetical protein